MMKFENTFRGDRELPGVIINVFERTRQISSATMIFQRDISFVAFISGLLKLFR